MSKKSLFDSRMLFVLIPWAFFLALFGYYVFYILPGRGFDFTDIGFYLYSALSVISPGYHVDPLSILMPGLYINGLFMLLGIKSLLGLRIVFLAMLLISIGIFIYGLDRNLAKSAYAPFVIAASLSGFYIALISYHTSADIFLMIGLGLFFISTEIEKKFVGILLICAAAFFLQLAVFSKIALLPAAIIAPTLLWLFYRKHEYIKYFLYASLVSFAIIFSSYLAIVGWHNFLQALRHPPSIHTQSPYAVAIDKLFSAIFLILKSFILPLASLAASWLILTVVAKFKSKAQRQYYGILSNRGLFVRVVLALLIIMFYFCYFFIYPMNHITKNIYHYSIIFGEFSFYSLSTCLILLGSKEATYFKAAVSAVVLYVFYLGYASTTNSAVIMPFAHMGIVFLCLSLTILFCTKLTSSLQLVKNIIVSLLAIVMIYPMLQTQMMYAYRSAGPKYAHSKLTMHPLQDLYVLKNKASVINQIKQAYVSNGCANKMFLAYPGLPMLYYVFSRSAPGKFSWLSESNTHFLPKEYQQTIIGRLSAVGHWCVIDAGYFNDPAHKNILPILSGYIKKNSDKVIVINTPKQNHRVATGYPLNMKIYVR